MSRFHSTPGHILKAKHGKVFWWLFGLSFIVLGETVLHREKGIASA